MKIASGNIDVESHDNHVLIMGIKIFSKYTPKGNNRKMFSKMSLRCSDCIFNYCNHTPVYN